MPLRNKVDRELMDADPRWSVVSETQRNLICQLIDDGLNVTAIKQFKVITDCGLAEAKRAVEAVLLRYSFVAPESNQVSFAQVVTHRCALTRQSSVSLVVPIGTRTEPLTR